MNTENPYHRWLGLDHHHPNHFELLGIDPNESDSGTIASAAKSALNQLGQSPAGNDQSSWKRVRRHIKLAYQCLKDPEQREIYRRNLASIPQDDSEPASSNSLPTPDGETNETIPQALPLAEIVEEEESETDGSLTRPSQPSMAAPIIDNADNGTRRRGRAGNAFPIFILLVLVSAGSWGAFKYIIQPQLANQDDELRTADETLVDPAKGDDSLDPQSRNESNSHDIPSDPIDNRTPDLANRPNHSASAEDRTNPPNDPEPDAQATDSSSETIDKNNQLTIDTSWATIGQPTPRDDLAIHHHLEESLLAMKRRLWETMMHHLRETRSYTLSMDQVAVWKRQMAIAISYRNFWENVVSKAKRLSSMTEFAIGEDRVVVVEAKKDTLVYRVFGQRIETRYEELPTLIALEISGYGLEDSDPDLMNNRVMAYCVAARFNPEQRAEAKRLSSMAREAGLMIDHYVEFLDDDVQSFYQPEQRFSRLQSAQVVSVIKKLSGSFDALKPVESFSDDELTDRIIELRNLSFGAEPDKAIAFTYRAIQLSIRAKNPDLLNEVLNLRRRFSRHGAYYPNYIGIYGQLMTRDLDDESAYRFIGYLLEIADQVRVEEKLTQASELVDHARSLATKHGFDTVTDRIDRIYGEGNPRKAGRLGM